MTRYVVAVDIGGTFVDAIEFDQQTGNVRLAKAPTTPGRPADGVIEAVRRLGTPLRETGVIVHGTTLGLNAVIERKGARTGILTNEGFRDLFEIGRADVPREHMYDFAYQRPEPLVKRRHRLGVPGRIDAQGKVVEPLDEAAVKAAARRLVADGVQAIAIAFLHSYRNPEHEERAAQIVREAFPQVSVSVSSAITREYREVERTATAVLDAYIRPIFDAYVGELKQALAANGFAGKFFVMRSGGGMMLADLAARVPIYTVMSGPAGGIMGATRVARDLKRSRLLSLDYGGTSLDAAVIENGEPLVMYEATLEHFPVLMPIFDIRCIGAGGGSIAWLQEGLLQVGPQSAGAVPGPLAYGRGGTEPTTTDAALVLGYMDPTGFLSGAMPLNIDASRTGMHSRLAEPLQTDNATVAAGIFDVLIAKTVGAIREITVERGKDPREFSLLAFGGAGPLIAPMIAREIGAVEVIVPNVPAAFSAWGMLMSDLVFEVSQTDIRPLDGRAWPQIEAGFVQLEAQALALLAEQGVPGPDRGTERLLECRYAGQEHSIAVAAPSGTTADEVVRRFNELHAQRYGHSLTAVVQASTLRVRSIGRLEKPPLEQRAAAESPQIEPRSIRDAYCFAKRAFRRFGVYARESLAPGHVISGPAIVDEGTSTTVIHSDQRLAVDAYGNLLIEMKVP
ncbi:MAG TPA: hydantoinase/oxoprolinase family protein [Steroidobacteraceae bacterium]|nr:hydantoinase/oxoprolinase family protein [Steroidobacteraceae bacterium]